MGGHCSVERSYAKNGTESSKFALLTLLLERISWLHRFSDALNCAEECVPAYETLEHERKSRPALRAPANLAKC